MDKISTYGELLYIGFNAEKGRARSQGFWKIGYKSSLVNHMTFLRKIIVRMNVNEFDNNDKELMVAFLELCKNDKSIGKFYNLSPEEERSLRSCDDFVFFNINSENCNNTLNNLMLEMVEDLLETLRNSPIDKEKIYILIRSLHNLPRLYLNEKSETLFNLRQPSISYEDAIKYSLDNMDNITKNKYLKYI